MWTGSRDRSRLIRIIDSRTVLFATTHGQVFCWLTYLLTGLLILLYCKYCENHNVYNELIFIAITLQFAILLFLCIACSTAIPFVNIFAVAYSIAIFWQIFLNVLPWLTNIKKFDMLVHLSVFSSSSYGAINFNIFVNYKTLTPWDCTGRTLT